MARYKQQQNFQPNSESGFNILESLVAMIVVSILMLAVAPVIAFSVGTRVQAKRIELAAQAGRSYIDAVRSGTVTVDDSMMGNTPPENTDAPTSIDELYCVDFDGEKDASGNLGCSPNSLTDMVVQGIFYRPNGATSSSGYCLGVRVYRANSFDGNVTLESPPTQTDGTTTNALGNRSLPLFQTTTEVIPQGSDFSAIKDRIGVDGTMCGS